MSHEVETMAWANEVPWHGLGQQVSPDASVDTMMAEAGLDWRVQELPLVAEGGIPVTSHKALVRDSDGRVLDVVGKDWKPVQNQEVFSFFKAFVEAGQAKMETAGSLRGGKMVWGLANLGQGFEVTGGDYVKGYVLLASPHESGKALIAKITPIRVVCANTMAMAIGSGRRGQGATLKGQSGRAFEYRMHHRMVFEPSVAVEALSLAREQLAEFEANAKKLAALQLSEVDAVAKVLLPVFTDWNEDDIKAVQDDYANSNLPPRIQEILWAMNEAPGHTEGTAWGVMNGVTYFADHMAGKAPDTRMSSAWMGSNADRKEQVFNRLLELAA